MLPAHRRKAWRREASLALLALLGASLCHGEGLTLEKAVSRTLERSPELKVLHFEQEAQKGAREQAAARPPLELGLLVENALGSGERSGTDAAESTLSIGFVLERGARARRIAVADAEGDQLLMDARLRRLDLAAETARRFIVTLQRQQALNDAREATTLAEQSLSAVDIRVRAAKAPQAESARAQAHLARARLDLEHAEHELESSRHLLAAMWADREPDFERVAGDLLTLSEPPAFEQFRSRLELNADFERLVSEKRLREAQMHLAQMRGRPPWHLTAGVRRFEDRSDNAFIVGFTVPLASRDLARGAVSEARARSSLVDAQREALRTRLDAELFALYQELRHAFTETGTLRNDVLPRIEEALTQSRYAYERGRYGYVEWIAAQRELLEVRRALIEAYSEYHQFRIEIERLTGTALGVSGTP